MVKYHEQGERTVSYDGHVLGQIDGFTFESTPTEDGKSVSEAHVEDRLDAIAARKALADPVRISFEDARKELGLDDS